MMIEAVKTEGRNGKRAICKSLILLMARDGIEPPTHGFSVLKS
jgi:hypothetical protein